VPEYPLLSEARARLIRLALDTGATTTMVPPKAALAIGVNPTRSTILRETLTASGKELIPLVVIPAIRLFETTLRRVTVACHDLPAESPVDGLLGLDLLTRLRAVIDVSRPSIHLPRASKGSSG
jgi:predicted aspartyl protease